MSTKKYMLREIVCEDELEQFFRLRYNCFCKSDAELFVTKNASDIDLNYYDRNSNHYGLYLEQNNVSVPVGYFRIILEKPTKANLWTGNISQRLGLAVHTSHKPSSRFPCLNAYPDNNLEHEFYTKKLPGEKVGEVSRFLIVKSERSLRLSLLIIRSAFAIGLLQMQHAFIGCFHEHAKAYIKFGFKQYPGSSTFFVDLPSEQKKGIILYCKTGYLSNELKITFEKIQDQFVENNSLIFHL